MSINFFKRHKVSPRWGLNAFFLVVLEAVMQLGPLGMISLGDVASAEESELGMPVKPAKVENGESEAAPAGNAQVAATVKPVESHNEPSRYPMPEMTKEEIDEIEEGKIITRSTVYRDSQGNKVASAMAIAIVNVPPDMAFQPAYDYENFSKFIPRTDKVEIVRKVDEHLWICHYWIDASIMTIEFELQLNHDFENHWVDWKMNPEFEEPDIKDVTGYWALYPWGGDGKRSLVAYVARIDSGRSWVPEFIVDFLSQSSLPEVVQNSRWRAETGMKWQIGDDPPAED